MGNLVRRTAKALRDKRIFSLGETEGTLDVGKSHWQLLEMPPGMSGGVHATGLPTDFAHSAGPTRDAAIASAEASSNTTSTPAAAAVANSSIPSYPQSPAAAHSFLTYMDQQAIAGAATSPPTATYLSSGGSGNPTGFTVCKGDYTMGSGSGSGLIDCYRRVDH